MHPVSPVLSAGALGRCALGTGVLELLVIAMEFIPRGPLSFPVRPT